MSPAVVQVVVHSAMVICMPMQFWAAALSSSLGILTARIVLEMVDGK